MYFFVVVVGRIHERARDLRSIEPLLLFVCYHGDACYILIVEILH